MKTTFTYHPGTVIDCSADVVAHDTPSGDVMANGALWPPPPARPVAISVAALPDGQVGVLVGCQNDRAYLSLNRQPWSDLGKTYGRNPVRIRVVDGRFDWLVVDSATTHVRNGASGTHAHTSQGVWAFDPDGRPMLTDEILTGARNDPGLVIYSEVDGFRVGQREAAIGPDALMYVDQEQLGVDGRVWTGIWQSRVVLDGLFRNPRTARDRDGSYTVVSDTPNRGLLVLRGDPPFAIEEPEQPEETWIPVTDGKPVDLYSYVVGAPDDWPAIGPNGEYMHCHMEGGPDGGRVRWLKSPKGFPGEIWGIRPDGFTHALDEIYESRGSAYRFSTATRVNWIPRPWRVGAELDCRDNLIQFLVTGVWGYTVDDVWTPGAWGRHPYVMRFRSLELSSLGRHRAVVTYDMGPTFEDYTVIEGRGWRGWKETIRG